MSSLTPEAYAVIEGRPSDPFHYLGPHVDDDGSVVRVFLPDAEGSPSSTSMATNTTERAPGASRLHPQLDLRIATRKHSVNRLPNLTHHWSASLEPDRITRRL
jgi:hypothetical protein